MPRPPLLTPLVLCAALTALQCGTGPEPAARQPPRIAFAATTHDFGSVEQGTAVAAKFTFRNVGGTTLTIDDLKAACDCGVKSPVRVISPGGTGAIEATFDTARVLHEQQRTVTVYTNDPSQPFATLTLTGQVTADVAADPPQLYVGRLGRGAQAQGEVRIVASRPVRLRFGPAGPVLTASLQQRAEDGGEVLTVAIRPDAPPGRFSETINIVTSSWKHPRLEISVAGIVECEEK